MGFSRPSTRGDHSPGASSSPLGSPLDQIRHAVQDIRYGEVRVVIQDGVIVQIDRVEKLRTT